MVFQSVHRRQHPNNYHVQCQYLINTSASLLSHSSSSVVEVLDTSRRFFGASISEKNDKADNVGDTETNSQGLGTSKHQQFQKHLAQIQLVSKDLVADSDTLKDEADWFVRICNSTQ